MAWRIPNIVQTTRLTSGSHPGKSRPPIGHKKTRRTRQQLWLTTLWVRCLSVRNSWKEMKKWAIDQYINNKECRCTCIFYLQSSQYKEWYISLKQYRRGCNVLVNKPKVFLHYNLPDFVSICLYIKPHLKFRDDNELTGYIMWFWIKNIYLQKKGIK